MTRRSFLWSPCHERARRADDVVWILSRAAQEKSLLGGPSAIGVVVRAQTATARTDGGEGRWPGHPRERALAPGSLRCFPGRLAAEGTSQASPRRRRSRRSPTSRCACLTCMTSKIGNMTSVTTSSLQYRRALPKALALRRPSLRPASRGRHRYTYQHRPRSRVRRNMAGLRARLARWRLASGFRSGSDGGTRKRRRPGAATRSPATRHLVGFSRHSSAPWELKPPLHRDQLYTGTHSSSADEIPASLPLPALALAAPPAGTPHDCSKKCDCASSAKAQSQGPSDFVKVIWTSP